MFPIINVGRVVKRHDPGRMQLKPA